MDYVVAESLDRALVLLAEGAASGGLVKPVAGGTDIAVQIADGVLSPSTLVDISGIEELRRIDVDGGGLRIGGAVPLSRIADSGLVPRCLRQGAKAVGSPQIRNIGTIGGNVCNASPCGDTLAPLLALDARFELRSARGVRVVEAKDFFTGPKKTILEADELLTAALVGRDALEGRSAFRKIGKRNGQAISQVNTAVRIRTAPGGYAVEEAWVAFGSAAPTPLRLTGVERFLRGTKPCEALVERAEELLDAELRPISDVRASRVYRFAVARALLRDALEEALGGIPDS